MSAQKQPKPVALIILDGFGEREDATDNAIAAAKTPTWDKLKSEYPRHVSIKLGNERFCTLWGNVTTI